MSRSRPLTLAVMVIGHDHVHHNVSDSLPVSWFWVWQDYTVTRGDLVEFCPPMGFDSEAHARGYVRNGPCPGGTIPFLKMVAAIAGDRVEIEAGGIRVNGRLLANSKPKAVDRMGRHLVSQAFGVQRIPLGFVWLYGTNVWSADSRYYGAVPVNTIRYRARPLIASALPDLR